MDAAAQLGRCWRMPRPSPLLVRSAIKTAIPPLSSSVVGTMPATQAPQLASSAEAPPEGDEWLSELKLDGYRLLVFLHQGRVRLLTRNGHDWTDRMPLLAERFQSMRVEAALLDGELVSLRPDGTSSFHDLQSSLSDGRDGDLYFYAFDLLHLNGWDLRPSPLIERKRALEGLGGWGDKLRYAEHVIGNAAALQREACKLKVEGIICKRADSSYRPGRSAAWRKVKCQGREDFVVLGWTPPGGSRRGVGALAVGFYDPEERLHYAGAVGTGFSDKELISWRTHLETMRLSSPPSLQVAGDPPDRQIRWVRPELVVELSFTAWSGEGRLRHPVFLGLREDKTAREVVMPVPDPEAQRREVKPLTVVEKETTSQSRWHGAVPPRPRPLVRTP
jgi:bifunctional non-homologous end joining protein LigD